VWTKDEETFAYLMSHFVALALERRALEKAQREEPPSSLHGAFPQATARTEP
jgi:hypothetical protein